MTVLGGLTSLYMILIFIRIMLTWFGGMQYGKPMEILSGATDPYLNWFRRFPALRLSFLDLSPIAALAVLTVLNNLFTTLGRHGSVSLGFILALILSTAWSVVSFILNFFIIILVLRFIAYLSNRNIYSSFWRIIDNLAQPIQYRINRIIFRNRLVRYHTGIISAIGALLVLRIGLGFLLQLGIRALYQLPI
jgi:YggT family protein